MTLLKFKLTQCDGVVRTKAPRFTNCYDDYIVTANWCN